MYPWTGEGATGKARGGPRTPEDQQTGPFRVAEQHELAPNVDHPGPSARPALASRHALWHRPASLMLELSAVQLRVQPALVHQGRVRAGLHDPTAVDHQNLIRTTDR